MSADSNREKMPNVAAMIDQFRASGFTIKKIVAVEDFEAGARVGEFNSHPGFTDTGEKDAESYQENINRLGG